MSDLLDPKKNLAALGKVAVVIVVLALGLFGLYHTLGQDGKDTINELGFGKQVIPWVDRADTISRKLIEVNLDNIASTIQGILHPSGNKPTMGGHRVSKLNESVLAEFTVHWQGGILGTDYKTVVTWTFSEQQHEQAKVTFDTAPTNISRKNSEMLNDYFRTKMYPALVSNMER